MKKHNYNFGSYVYNLFKFFHPRGRSTDIFSPMTISLSRFHFNSLSLSITLLLVIFFCSSLLATDDEYARSSFDIKFNFVLGRRLETDDPGIKSSILILAFGDADPNTAVT